MALNFIQPVFRSRNGMQYLTLQMKAHVIERMTLSKINLLDKVKFEIMHERDTTSIEANNIKLNVFPESIREL